MGKATEFIINAGGCLVSKHIISGEGHLRWCVREASVNPADNGWRFLADIDTEEYLNTSGNLLVCDYNTVAAIEPAIIAIYQLPVGTDLTLVEDAGNRFFVDNNTGNPLSV